jgi:two-component system sensor histidine kinase YesM
MLVHIPAGDITTGIRSITDITVLLSLVSGLAVALLAILLLQRIYSPIRSITSDMAKINLGGHGMRINSLPENELGELANGINDMLDELNASTWRIIAAQNDLYELDLANKKSQILALQSQINPHFLYNTLDCISGMALEYNTAPIASIVASMSKIFRYAVGDEPLVSLSQELACTEHYLTIMRLRYDADTQLIQDIPDPIRPLFILRMTLQPLVENAFVHGLEEAGGNGVIRIAARIQGEYLIVQVTNSGSGLDDAQVAAINGTLRQSRTRDTDIGGGLALVNIHRRLLLSGGEPCGLAASVTPEGETCFTLTFKCEG